MVLIWKDICINRYCDLSYSQTLALEYLHPDNYLTIFGSSKELGNYLIEVNLPVPCEANSFEVELQIENPSCVMIDNHCFDNASSALEEIVSEDTIVIHCSLLTDHSALIQLPQNTAIKLFENVTWSIKD